jgi:hypothetical protein
LKGTTCTRTVKTLAWPADRSAQGVVGTADTLPATRWDGGY